MTPYIQRTLSIIILPQGADIFDEAATTITIKDDSGGEYLAVSQSHPDTDTGEIRIDPEEWPAIRDGIDSMFAEIEKHKIGRAQP